MPGLTALTKFEVLSKELLLEHPALELRPLAKPLLVLGVGGVSHIHSFRSNEAVERCSHIEKQLTLRHFHSPFIFSKLSFVYTFQFRSWMIIIFLSMSVNHDTIVHGHRSIDQFSVVLLIFTPCSSSRSSTNWKSLGS